MSNTKDEQTWESELVQTLISQEFELIDGVEELLTASRFLTLDPFAAYLRLRETPQWQYFKETYEGVERRFGAREATKQRLQQGMKKDNA